MEGRDGNIFGRFTRVTARLTCGRKTLRIASSPKRFRQKDSLGWEHRNKEKGRMTGQEFSHCLVHTGGFKVVEIVKDDQPRGVRRGAKYSRLCLVAS